MPENSKGLLAGLAGAVGLAGQADKLAEWANTVAEGTFELLKGRQEGKHAQRQRAHEVQMDSLKEFHLERQHSRAQEVIRLKRAHEVQMGSLKEFRREQRHSRAQDLIRLKSSQDILTADAIGRGEYERDLGRISASRQAAEDLEWSRALVQVALHNALRTREMELANSPFSDAPEKVRESVADVTGDGREPALLIAPFYHEGAVGAGMSPGFVVALRQAWLASPWHGDLKLMAGLIDRPLHRLDADVRAIQQVLHDLPVVLVYGQAQEGGRIWPSLAAWNILPTTGGTSLHMTFPPVSLEAADDPAEVQDLGDRLGRMFSLSAGNLGDWFHLLRHGRAPRMHTLLAAGEDSERALASTSGADSYDFLAATGQLDIHLAYAHQARILAEGGLIDLSGRMARTALAELAALPLDDGTRHLAPLRELVGLFGLLDDQRHAAEAETLREAAAQRRLDRLHGWEVC